ncbi:MAG: restriction endonuclease subunit S [Candidatus Sedimenticola sp. (ex Thyasira tokunagai)]
MPPFDKTQNGYKQTELGEIPEDWEIRHLGGIGAFTKGAGVKKDESNSGYIPCVRYGEIYTRHSDYIKRFNSYISKTVSLTATRLSKGDLLFAGSGETKEEIGKCVAFVDEVEAYAGGDIVILRPQWGDSLFLGYCLNSDYVVKQKSSKGQGDAVVHISANALKSVQVIMPSSEVEQQSIATVLFDMDKDIELLDRRLNKTQKLKQGMMQELLTGRTRLV